MRRLPWCLSLVLFVAACGTSTSTSSSTSTTTTTVAGSSQAALRGVLVRGVECPPQLVPPASRPTTIGAPESLVLCPLATPSPSPSSQPVTVTPGRPTFAALVAALSAPNEPKTNDVCAMYADMIQFVLARAGGRVYQVSIPVDGCGHYQRPALDALNHARGG